MNISKPPFTITYQGLQLNFNDWLLTYNNAYASEGIESWDDLNADYEIVSCYRNPLKNYFEIELRFKIGSPHKASVFAQLSTKVIVEAPTKKGVENVLETLGIYIHDEMNKELVKLDLRDKQDISFTIPPLVSEKEAFRTRFSQQRYNLIFQSVADIQNFLSETGSVIEQNLNFKTLYTLLTDEELLSVYEKYHPRVEVAAE